LSLGGYLRVRKRSDESSSSLLLVFVLHLIPSHHRSRWAIGDGRWILPTIVRRTYYSSKSNTMFSLHSCQRGESTRRPWESLSSLTPSASTTCCEPGNNSRDGDASASASSFNAYTFQQQQQDLPESLAAMPLVEQKALVQAELDRLELEGPCSSCLYTGVATCAGLAAYFTHIAYDTSDIAATLTRRQRHAQLKLMVQRRPYFLAISAGWLVAGAYRWHLG
jgi:hypothetical protein